MTRSLSLASIVLHGALAIACATNNAGNDTDASTSTASTASTTNPSGSQSGSVTSAPDTTTDETGSDSTPTMATATTTTPGTSDGTSSTSESCGFLSCNDMMNVMNECDSWVQDCPEGQKCTPYIPDGGGGWDALKCVDVTGRDQPGDECTTDDVASGIDTCIKGAMCWGVDMDGVGTCVALCTGSPEASVCPKNALCEIYSGGALNLCLPSCDPLLQDCTGNGDVCYPIADGFTCAPDDSGVEGQANDPCEFINVCDKGLMCADAAFVGAGCPPPATDCCTPFCKFPDGPCPNPDQQCVQYFDPWGFPENDPWLAIGTCGLLG